MVIDDSETVRIKITQIIKDKGHEVIEAENGQIALDIITKALDIDFCICDINMPEMDGLEMVRLVHLDDVLKDIPILMLTTEASKASKEIGKDAGVVAWITKPFKSEKVLSAVERVLKRKKKG